VITADNTPGNIALDEAFDGLGILLHIGAGGITFSGTNKIEIKLRHGDGTDPATHTAVEQDDVIGITLGADGIIKALTAAHAAAAAYIVGYKGSKQNLSVLADFSGTHGVGTLIGAWLLEGFAINQPLA
jgi:hypothetical protein